MANKVAIAVYGLLGLAAVAGGIWIGFRPVPGGGHLHLEFGSGLLTVGVISLLVAWRFRQSLPWRAAVILFFACMAVVHWHEFLNGAVPFASPVVNSLPLIALAAVEFAVRSRGQTTANPRQSVSG